MSDIQQWAIKVKNNISKVYYGKEEVLDKILTAFLCKGHVLLEDVPGVGKTVMAKAFSKSVSGRFSRIQCTPDLLPSDVLGVSVYSPKTGEFDFREGPLMANIVLVDEINRAVPRTQSALLEAMSEGQLTVEGKSRILPKPFFVLATENPVEFEGTFPLPEAQKDRFFLSVNLGYPDRKQEKHVLSSHSEKELPLDVLTPVTDIEEVLAMQNQIRSVHVAPEIEDYILDIITMTRQYSQIRLGASPRGTLALYQGAQAYAAVKGRDYVVPDDVKALTGPVLNKRIILTPEALIRGATAPAVITEVCASVTAPPGVKGK